MLAEDGLWLPLRPAGSWNKSGLHVGGRQGKPRESLRLYRRDLCSWRSADALRLPSLSHSSKLSPSHRLYIGPVVRPEPRPNCVRGVSVNAAFATRIPGSRTSLLGLSADSRTLGHPAAPVRFRSACSSFSFLFS